MHLVQPAPGQFDLAAVRALLGDDWPAVNREIQARVGSDVALVSSVAHYIIGSGGKRLRPLITLLSARACGYEGDRHIVAAAIIEFIHTATLLHDDVVDGSQLRRGQDTANSVFGNEASVLVGDFLYSRAFQMMVQVGQMRLMDVMADATNTIAEGEVLQLMNCRDPDTTEARYMEVIYRKTARLFEAGAQVGAILAAQSRAVEDGMVTYGRELGLAFQLVDDALDYGGSSMTLGKRVGDDFREGKVTLPVVLAARAGGDADRPFWSRTIEQGDVRDGDLDTAIELMTRHGAITETVERAKAYGARALDSLDAVPDGPARDVLGDVVAFCVSRVS
jgi:octaprenyl-diphosphate synthase